MGERGNNNSNNNNDNKMGYKKEVDQKKKM